MIVIRHKGHLFKGRNHIDGVTLFVHWLECPCGLDLDYYALPPQADEADERFLIWSELLAIEDIFDNGGYSDLTIEELAIKMGVGELVEERQSNV